MAKSQLKKATITKIKGKNSPLVINVLFNPTEYSLERTNSYKSTVVPGLATPLVQFVNGECDQLSMELFLDDYTDPDGPTSLQKPEKIPLNQRLAQIMDLTEIDADLHAPPPVKFNWGPFDFTAVVEKLSRKVTMFHPDGTPARATLAITFKEYRTLQRQLETPRRESADKSKRRQITGREQLWLVAAREYNDPQEWVRIATANDLDDPREIQPGDWLWVPPLEHPDGTGSIR